MAAEEGASVRVAVVGLEVGAAEDMATECPTEGMVDEEEEEDTVGEGLRVTSVLVMKAMVDEVVGHPEGFEAEAVGFGKCYLFLSVLCSS